MFTTFDIIKADRRVVQELVVGILESPFYWVLTVRERLELVRRLYDVWGSA